MIDKFFVFMPHSVFFFGFYVCVFLSSITLLFGMLMPALQIIHLFCCRRWLEVPPPVPRSLKRSLLLINVSYLNLYLPVEAVCVKIINCFVI